MSLFCPQNRTGVKTQAIVGGYHWIVAGAVVFKRIRNHKQVLFEYRVFADGNIQRSLTDSESDLGLEPLTVPVQKIQNGNRHFADAGGHSGEFIKQFLRFRVQNLIPVQRLKTFLIFTITDSVLIHTGIKP
jgi:hypothetical protein